MPQRISLDPDPPQAGKSCTICYDFEGLELTETKLYVSYSPPSPGEGTVTLTPAARCADVAVPDADHILVEDTSAESPDKEAEILD